MKAKLKGWIRETQVRKILEKEGYTVIRSGGSLGCFDLVAFNNQHLRLIQVKSGRISPKERKAIEEFKNCPPNTTKEYWLKDNYKPWRIFKLEQKEDKQIWTSMSWSKS